MKITLPFSGITARTFLVFIALDILFVVLHVFVSPYTDLFNLDRERNFPSYYSGLKLFGAAIFAAVVFLLSKKKPERIFWAVMMAVFVELSLDDLTELHENIAYYAVYVKNLSFMPGLFRSPTHNWVFLFAPFFAVLAGYFLYAIIRLRCLSGIARRLFFGGAAFFILAIFLELVGGIIRVPAFYKLLSILEELTEMLGATYFTVSFLLVARERFNQQYHRTTSQCPINGS
ncbi:hypothetical protein HY622_01325 [Candidatus Uhrbacteria bacterium]|nr:hypothetical protein [Candidatus Uhrbacteria bacterium]